MDATNNGRATLMIVTNLPSATHLSPVAIVRAAPAAPRAELECIDPRVRISGQPDARWIPAIAASCEAMTRAVDTDSTARVRLVPADRDLVIEVALRDGRTASRRVSDTEWLEPTLEALLTVLPAAETTPKARPNPVAVDPHETPPAPEPAPAVASPVPAFGIDVGFGLGGRVSGPNGYASFAASAFGQLHSGSLLIGMAARWDIFQGPPFDPPPLSLEMQTVGVGLYMGRRFSLPFGIVDVGLTPRFVVEMESYAPDPADDEINDSATDIRVGAFARAGFGHGAFRPFAELDGELSPGRIRKSIRINPLLPALPAWSAGLSIGLMWSDP